MNCPTCQTPLVPGAKFCANCGAPAPQMTQVGSYQEPVPESDNPKDPIVLGDTSIKIEGELVPVVDVELGSQQTVYFEHHILLEAAQRYARLHESQKRGQAFFAGPHSSFRRRADPATSRFRRSARADRRDAPLSRPIDRRARTSSFPPASSNVAYDFYWQTRVIANLLFLSHRALHRSVRGATRRGRLSAPTGYGTCSRRRCSPGKCSTSNRARGFGKTPTSGWTRCGPPVAGRRRPQGASARSWAAPLTLNRFYGPGRIGLQSMTYHEPQREGAQQQGGQSNVGNVLGQLFGDRQ